jgi:hypothetical protein
MCTAPWNNCGGLPVRPLAHHVIGQDIEVQDIGEEVKRNSIHQMSKSLWENA